MKSSKMSSKTPSIYTREGDQLLTYSGDLAEAILRASSPEEQLSAIRVILRHAHGQGADWRRVYEVALIMEPPHFPAPPPEEVAPEEASPEQPAVIQPAA
jgi:hypothetical protein